MIIKISQLLSNAFLKSNSSMLMNAVVKPHPGQLKRNIVFQIHGMQRSIPVRAFSVAKKKM
jgi:hypothetical protein